MFKYLLFTINIILFVKYIYRFLKNKKDVLSVADLSVIRNEEHQMESECRESLLDAPLCEGRPNRHIQILKAPYISQFNKPESVVLKK